MNKKIYLTLILGIFLFSFASAISSLDPVKKGDCVELFQYCNDCTFVNWTGMEYPNDLFNLSVNEPMTKINLNYNYTYCGVNETGDYKYFVTGDKNNKIQQEEIHFKVNLSGKEFNIKDIIPRFILILFFGILIFFTYKSSEKINFEKWYKKIKSKYQDTNRNYVKFVLGGIGYELMKNMWVIYYSIGFIISMLLMDITYLSNIESVFEVMKVLMFIYSWSFILVGLVFLSYLQEFFKWIIEEVENENWGISNDK